jgi:hypothetical protein
VKASKLERRAGNKFDFRRTRKKTPVSAACRIDKRKAAPLILIGEDADNIEEVKELRGNHSRRIQ